MCGISVFVVGGSKEKFSFKFNVTHLMVEGQFINRTHFVLQFGEGKGKREKEKKRKKEKGKKRKREKGKKGKREKEKKKKREK